MMFAVTAHLRLSGSLINLISPHFHILSKAMMTAAIAVIIAFVRIVFITTVGLFRVLDQPFALYSEGVSPV